MRTFNRRSFLKTTGSAAIAGASLPLIFSKSARAAPNSRINVASIGVGGQGSGLLGAFLGDAEVQHVAVCDVFKPNRDKARARVDEKYAADKKSGAYKGCDVYSDFREVLARDDIDAVVIATPDHWHALIAIAAAKAGKDIYCEKPLSLTVADGRAMVNAVRQYGRVLQTGSQQRSDGAKFRYACELVRSGAVGKVKEVYVKVGGPPTECHLPAEPVPEGMDWNMWLGPAPYRAYNKGIHPFSWRMYRDYSGGWMTDWGAHHFDIAQWGLGMDESGPLEIIPPGTQGNKRLTYVYANGVKLFHINEWLERTTPKDELEKDLFMPFPSANGVLFVGDEGWIFVNREKITSSPASLVTRPIGPNDVHLYHSPGHQRDFLNCIHTRQRPIADVEIGCRSASVCHLGNIAYWLGRPLKWDPAAEQFFGDEAANRWVDRPKRAPWTL